VGFDLVDHETAFARISEWIRRHQRHYVAVANPHSVLLCRRDPDMGLAIRQAGLVLPDGVGITLAARMLGLPHRGRVTGPMFMLNACDWGRQFGHRHFFYGGRPGVADRLAGRLVQAFPGLQVAGTYCPPFRDMSDREQEDTASRMNASRPDVVWVGLGAPKQEKWMLHNASRIDVPVMVGVGAAFDFHSGNVRWAPAMIRHLGLEWAFRLLAEPKRLWRRNLDNFPFLMAVLKQRFRGQM